MGHVRLSSGKCTQAFKFSSTCLVLLHRPRSGFQKKITVVLNFFFDFSSSANEIWKFHSDFVPNKSRIIPISGKNGAHILRVLLVFFQIITSYSRQKSGHGGSYLLV